MRIAISNIAWDPSENEIIAKILNQKGIDAIDVAPGKYFPEPTKATDKEIIQVKNWWADRGIEITGMQALLFGTKGLNMFGPANVQSAMLQHLGTICHIGSKLGAKRLVFGSPKNRDRTGLSDQQAADIAVPFFQKLGDIAQNHGVIICLEPNPPCYGANFMTTTSEAAEIVKLIIHPSIKLQLDTGAITINDEDLNVIMRKYSHLTGHIHASEPDLLPLENKLTNHYQIGVVLKEYLPTQIVSVEMLATTLESQKAAIIRALDIVIESYYK